MDWDWQVRGGQGGVAENERPSGNSIYKVGNADYQRGNSCGVETWEVAVFLELDSQIRPRWSHYLSTPVNLFIYSKVKG